MIKFLFFPLILFGGCYMIKNSAVEKKDRAILIFAFIVLVLFCGGTDAVNLGTDIKNYYNNVRTAMLLSREGFLDVCAFEKGYANMIWYFAKVFKNPQLFLFFDYAFFNLAIMLFIKDNSEDVFLSVVTYACLGTWMFYFTALRQGFALALCLYAFMLAKRNHRIFAIGLILFATLFHQTAIVMLPIVFLDKLKLNMTTILAFLAGSTILALFMDRFVALGNEQFEMDYEQGAAASSGTYINLVIIVITLYLFYMRFRADKAENVNQKKNGTIVAMTFMLMTGFVLYLARANSQALERVAFYYTPAMIILLPYGIRGTLGRKEERMEAVSTLFVLLSGILLVFRYKHTFGDYFWIWF